MLPYIYSVFATEVASEAGATLQRALVMEFPDDLAVRQTADSFMFGSSFLVFPVLKYQEASHKCYLPIPTTTATGGLSGSGSGSFVDFWSGESHAAGSTVTAAVVLERIPLFVRAASIVPLGPHLQVCIPPCLSSRPRSRFEAREVR
jgi:alpha-D-xyloside xylohydrolase|eukprot:COSAG06_NODE_1565_length_9086_cov_34.853566_6_plen_147_part_00